jgi:hypothetical protein
MDPWALCEGYAAPSQDVNSASPAPGPHFVFPGDQTRATPPEPCSSSGFDPERSISIGDVNDFGLAFDLLGSMPATQGPVVMLDEPCARGGGMLGAQVGLTHALPNRNELSGSASQIGASVSCSFRRCEAMPFFPGPRLSLCCAWSRGLARCFAHRRAVAGTDCGLLTPAARRFTCAAAVCLSPRQAPPPRAMLAGVPADGQAVLNYPPVPAQYWGEHHLTRVSAKIFNCTPSSLPANIKEARHFPLGPCQIIWIPTPCLVTHH